MILLSNNEGSGIIGAFFILIAFGLTKS